MTTTLLDRTPTLNLRPGTTVDHDALWRIFQPVLQTRETYAMPADTTRDEALAYWTANEGPWFVAELDGQIVGACMIHPNQPGLGSHVANAAFVVDAAARGHRVGRHLVQQAIDAAQAEGYRAMQFNLVVATNTSAIHLYQSLGFQIIACEPEAFHWRAERYVDAYVFHRFLDRSSRQMPTLPARSSVSPNATVGGDYIKLTQ
jgi:ribosomal protein S18 acetylase RimI-like enzyme